jgi:cob(I)alamin adenosyltransferase
MGARLTRIYTRTGDKGETGLVGGRRVSKDAPRIATYGTVDELNSALGVVLAFQPGRKSAAHLQAAGWLAAIQHDLFSIGAQLATPTKEARVKLPAITRDQIRALERLIDEMESELIPLRQFILPGGTPPAALVHLARTICRRAERGCVALAKHEDIGDLVIPYLNRLGDFLFVLARWLNQKDNRAETPWKK